MSPIATPNFLLRNMTCTVYLGFIQKLRNTLKLGGPLPRRHLGARADLIRTSLRGTLTDRGWKLSYRHEGFDVYCDLARTEDNVFHFSLKKQLHKFLTVNC